MKRIKIILVIVTLLVVGFLSIGLFIKETVYTTEIKIEKPLRDVFIAFNDITKLKEWIPELTSVEVMEEKTGRIGSKYKIKVNNKGQELVMLQKVLKFVPNKEVTLFYDTGAGSMLKTNKYEFTSEGNTTLITQKVKCRSNGYLMACMFPIFKSKFKSQDQEYLHKFKTFIEKE